MAKKKAKRVSKVIPIREHNRKIKQLEKALSAQMELGNKSGERMRSLELDYQKRLEFKDKEIANVRKHPHRLEEQMKVWTYSLNKLGIGVRLISEWVIFRRAGIDIRMGWDDLLLVGIPKIIAMFDPVPTSALDPQNNVDGEEGWKHPDIAKDEKDVATEQANATLARVGMKINDMGSSEEIQVDENPSTDYTLLAVPTSVVNKAPALKEVASMVASMAGKTAAGQQFRVTKNRSGSSGLVDAEVLWRYILKNMGQ